MMAGATVKPLISGSSSFLCRDVLMHTPQPVLTPLPEAGCRYKVPRAA